MTAAEEYLINRIAFLELENEMLRKQLEGKTVTFAFQGVNMNNSYIVSFEDGNVKIEKEEPVKNVD